MTEKIDALVLVEASEIMRSLPSAMQCDDQIMGSVIESLQSGQSVLSVRTDAIEIAQMKLQETVAHGFNLVNTEIQGIRHEQEKSKIHLGYALEQAKEARQIANHAIARVYEIATTPRARPEIQRTSRVDPIAAGWFAVCFVVLIVFGAIAITKTQQPIIQPATQPQRIDILECDRDVLCTPINPITPARGV